MDDYSETIERYGTIEALDFGEINVDENSTEVQIRAALFGMGDVEGTDSYGRNIVFPNQASIETGGKKFVWKIDLDNGEATFRPFAGQAAIESDKEAIWEILSVKEGVNVVNFRSDEKEDDAVRAVKVDEQEDVTVYDTLGHEVYRGAWRLFEGEGVFVVKSAHGVSKVVK